MTAIATPRTAVLADRLPGSKAVRTALMVTGFALLTAAAAQISFPLPWTPVPVTGQTFAVLLSGAVLGWKAGAGSQLLYVALGAVGLPFYADGASGWTAVSGATGGYLVGFIAAAALIGYLAERGQDRSVVTSIPAMLAGTAIIYLFGVSWLAHSLGVPGTKAMELGLVPFVVGDALKLALAGGLVPGVWRLTRDPDGDPDGDDDGGQDGTA